MGDNTAPGSWQLLFVLCPKPLSPVFPQMYLVHSSFLLQGCTVCGCLLHIVTLHSAVRLKHHRAWEDSLLCLVLLFSLRLLLLGKEWSACTGWLLPYRAWLSTGMLASMLSAFSPKLPSPVFPQTPLAHSASAFARAQGKWLQMKSYVLAPFFNLLKKIITEDCSKIGGRWIHLLVHPTGKHSWSSGEQREQ